VGKEIQARQLSPIILKQHIKLMAKKMERIHFQEEIEENPIDLDLCK
jgi:hypothetical protein